MGLYETMAPLNNSDAPVINLSPTEILLLQRRREKRKYIFTMLAFYYLFDSFIFLCPTMRIIIILHFASPVRANEKN